MSPSSDNHDAQSRPSERAPWHWQYDDASGTQVEPASYPEGGPYFPSQSDAESWVGEVWRELADEGVAAVTLLEESRVVYGPMGLGS